MTSLIMHQQSDGLQFIKHESRTRKKHRDENTLSL